jgi:hypothetical protein
MIQISNGGEKDREEKKGWHQRSIFQERRTAKLEELFPNSQPRPNQRRLRDSEIALSYTNSEFLTWLRLKVAVRQDEGDSCNSNHVYNSYGMYVGNRSEQNRREAEIESLQTDIEDFKRSRKSILGILLTGGDGCGLEWGWCCVSGVLI